MCYYRAMESVHLGDFGRNPEDVLRRLEEESQILIVDAGQPVAKLVRAETCKWRRWTEVADLFAGPGDPDRLAERDGISDSINDPWDRPIDR